MEPKLVNPKTRNGTEQQVQAGIEDRRIESSRNSQVAPQKHHHLAEQPYTSFKTVIFSWKSRVEPQNHQYRCLGLLRGGGVCLISSYIRLMGSYLFQQFWISETTPPHPTPIGPNYAPDRTAIWRARNNIIVTEKIMAKKSVIKITPLCVRSVSVAVSFKEIFFKADIQIQCFLK